MQADTTFTKVLLPISQRQDLVPEADRVTIILPNDAALQNWMQDQPSAGTEEMVPVRSLLLLVAHFFCKSSALIVLGGMCLAPAAQSKHTELSTHCLVLVSF